MLPEPLRTVTLFNPVVYLNSGFRWSFYGTSDVAVGISLAATLAFFFICLGIVAWIFKTGYRLKSSPPLPQTGGEGFSSLVRPALAVAVEVLRDEFPIDAISENFLGKVGNRKSGVLGKSVSVGVS